MDLTKRVDIPYGSNIVKVPANKVLDALIAAGVLLPYTELDTDRRCYALDDDPEHSDL